MPLDPESMTSKAMHFNTVSLGQQSIPNEGDLGDDDSPSPKCPKRHKATVQSTPAEMLGAGPSPALEIHNDNQHDCQQVECDAQVADKLHHALNEPDDARDKPTEPEHDPDELVEVHVTVDGMSMPIKMTRSQISEFCKFGVVNNGTAAWTDTLDSEDDDCDERLARAQAGKCKASPSKMTDLRELRDTGVRAATGFAHCMADGIAPSPYVNVGFGFAAAHVGQIPANGRLAQAYKQVQQGPHTPTPNPIVALTPKLLAAEGAPKPTTKCAAVDP